MSPPGFWEWLLIIFAIVLLFGVKKLPALGGAIGESIKNFKRGIREAADEDKRPLKPGEGNDGKGS